MLMIIKCVWFLFQSSYRPRRMALDIFILQTIFGRNINAATDKTHNNYHNHHKDLISVRFTSSIQFRFTFLLFFIAQDIIAVVVHTFYGVLFYFYFFHSF